MSFTKNNKNDRVEVVQGLEITFRTCRPVSDGGCGKEKVIEEFGVRTSRGKKYRESLCLECVNRRRREIKAAKDANEGREPAKTVKERFKPPQKKDTGPQAGTPQRKFFCDIPISMLAQQLRMQALMEKVSEKV